MGNEQTMNHRAFFFLVILPCCLIGAVVPSQLCFAQEAPESPESPLIAAVNVVLDCSGSMGLKDVPSSNEENVRRGDVCRRVVGEALDSLKGSKVGVGLVLFGHRSYWKLSDDGTYTVQMSALGKKQNLDITEVDPSFDVSQEIALDAPTEQQLQRIKEIFSEIEYRRGAQSPSVQAIDKAVSELDTLPDTVKSRHVLLVTDGINQLADQESGTRDTTLESLAEKMKVAADGQEGRQPVKLHVILFGQVFKADEAGEYGADETTAWVEGISKLVKETGGEIRTAADSESLSDAMSSTLAGLDSRKTGEISGEILKNGRLVGSSAEFKVMLMEGEDSRAEPVVSKDGKFRFQNVPAGRKYTIKVTGRIRNRLFQSEVKEVTVRAGQSSDPVKVNLE
jgi:hypothetical protein